jgi:hypothetical protein
MIYISSFPDENIFSFTVDMLRDIVTGLEHLEDHNVRLPYPLEYSLEYDLKLEHTKISKMLEMNFGKSDDPKLRPRPTSKNKQLVQRFIYSLNLNRCAPSPNSEPSL